MLRVIKSEIVATAVKPSQYPEDDLPEIAFCGRSNVGKSSLLNLITGRKKLAKVSASPGKTRTINFYLINDAFRIVDLPGYGYAKVSKKESERWGEMIERYLTGRHGLRTVFQLVDSRHEPTAQDRQMYKYLCYYGLNGPVIATKSDKLSKSQLEKNLRMIRKTLDMEERDRLIPVSALKKTGQEELLAAVEEFIEV
ncbi:MAG: ribosome biogenesis GTP-binding protein YihA/YsxC [Anaerovoracaceae bacterium]|jgi:GTP-binding protein